MTTQVQKALISFRITGEERASIEELEVTGDNITIFYRRGDWVVYCFQTGPSFLGHFIKLPSGAILTTYYWGLVDPGRYEEALAELGKFRRDFVESVHPRWFNYWAEKVQKLGVLTDAEEVERREAAILDFYDDLTYIIARAASTPEGRRILVNQDLKKDYKSIAHWFSGVVLYFIYNDVRFTFGKYWLAEKVEYYFQNCVQRVFGFSPKPLLPY